MKEYGMNYDFEVSFQNVVIGFSKVSNMQAKIEYDVVQEGGNDIPILLPIPSKQPDTITFEKGLLLSSSQSDWDKLRPGMMVCAVAIHVKRNGSVIRKLTFDQGIVLQKEYPLLDAMSDGIYIEKLQIAHTGLKEENSFQ